MTEVDVEVAKQNAGPLLDRVMQGEQVTIVQFGRPFAQVLPVEQQVEVRTPEKQALFEESLAKLDALRESMEPGGYSWAEMKQLRDFGRR